jgi:uncharacterized LabA/DUF88 family protein
VASRLRAALGILFPASSLKGGMRICRAVVFIDGANLYHALKAASVQASAIDPYKVARKLVEHRTLVEVRYYIAEIDRSAPAHVYRAHRELTARLRFHPSVRLCMGHIQCLQQENPCAAELGRYLAGLSVRLPSETYRALMGIARRHGKLTVYREKGVDVFLACDLVDLGRADTYDVAYLVSGDADFCPAVAIARAAGKRVFVASPDISARLIRACDVSIRLVPGWFGDCRF